MPPDFARFPPGLPVWACQSFEQDQYTPKALRFGRRGSNPRSREFLVTAEVALSTLLLVMGGLPAVSIRLREVLIQ